MQTPDHSTDQLYLGQLSLFSLSHAQRCEVAAAAGFTGVSLFWMDVEKQRAAGGRDVDLRAQADAHGLRIVQLEFAPLAHSSALDDFKKLAEDMANCAVTLGCDSVHAVALDPTLDFDDCVACMKILAAACAKHDLDCGLEFVPFLTACTDLPSALRVISAVDKANTGIVLDALHFFRGGAQWETLAQLRPRDVITLQINDGTRGRVIDDYSVEAMAARLLPGRGELDLPRFLKTLRGGGIELPFTVEAPHQNLNALEPALAARMLADTARELRARCSH